MDKLNRIIGKIEFCTNSFIKNSGIHQGPPELHKDIFRKVAEVYGGHVWALMNYKLKKNPNDSKLRELRDYASKFADKPKIYKSIKKIKIPINLNNWKPYEDLSEKHRLPRRWKDLVLSLNFIGHVHRGGRASSMGEIEIDVTSMPRNITGFKQVLQKFKSIIRHEVSHIGQFIINDMVGRDVGGKPSDKIKTEITPKIKRLKRFQKERLKEMEFYTYLGDAVDEFKDLSRELSSEQKVQLAKYFMALIPFSPIKMTTDSQIHFQALRKYAPDKWKKAVKEFIKAIDLEIPNGSIPGEVSPSPWSPEQFMDAVKKYNELLYEDPDSEEAKELLKSLQYQESIKS